MNKEELHKATVSERRLWACYLYYNVRDSIGASSCPLVGGGKRFTKEYVKYHKNKNTRSAIEWFMSTEMWVGSFEWICEILDLEPNKIREGILSGKINKKSLYRVKLNESTEPRKGKDGNTKSRKNQPSQPKKSSSRASQG